MAAPAFAGIRVEGLRELDRAFRYIDKTSQKQLRSELKDAAEPVRSAAEQLAAASITNIGIPWSRMRIGIAGGGAVVYVAPASRRRAGSPRGNLAALLMEQAMLPALEQHRENIIGRLDAMIDRVSSEAGF